MTTDHLRNSRLQNPQTILNFPTEETKLTFDSQSHLSHRSTWSSPHSPLLITLIQHTITMSVEDPTTNHFALAFHSIGFLVLSHAAWQVYQPGGYQEKIYDIEIDWQFGSNVWMTRSIIKWPFSLVWRSFKFFNTLGVSVLLSTSKIDSHIIITLTSEKIDIKTQSRFLTSTVWPFLGSPLHSSWFLISQPQSQVRARSIVTPCFSNHIGLLIKDELYLWFQNRKFNAIQDTWVTFMDTWTSSWYP